MEKLMELLSELHPEVDFASETGLIDKKILTSFDVVNLVGELMDEYDIEINAEHLVPENFNSAQAIYDLITRLEEE